MNFTSGNIITLCISLVLIILFRQLDKNNRSIEKVKKFGDKLKAELEIFIKERTAALQESSIALDVQQAKAVAAVKRLESIREDLSRKEAEVIERTKAVADLGKQFDSYDRTVKQLLEMTAHAETNLARITTESDFADSLGKKLAASQEQLSAISAALPSLRESFTAENKKALAAVQTDTLARISATISDLEQRVDIAHRSGTELAAASSEKLKELFQKAFNEAARRADTLEDGAFAKLKEQAGERLAKYKENVDEKTAALHEHTKEKLQDTQQLVKTFKADWQSEAGAFLETTRAELRRLEELADASVSGIEARLKSAETGTETRLDAYNKDLDYRLAQFDRVMGDVDRLDEQLRVSMAETEKRVTADFNLYAQDQQSRQGAFESKIRDEAETVSARMRSLETGLNELKSRAYDNVSEKLKLFEDDFFADLAKRSDAITAALEGWKANVDTRLEALSAESESGRKDTEAAHALALKERLAEIGEQYRLQASKLEEQMLGVETDLRSRITASDQSILAFVEQFRAEFAQARENANLHVQNELGSHAITVQELLRKQEREVESRTREFIDTIENAKNESETALVTIRTGFSSWQSKNDLQLAEARTLFADRIAAFTGSSSAAIADIETAWQTNYRDFVARTSAERKELKDSLDTLKTDISAAIAGFSKTYENLAADSEKRIRETGTETDQTVRGLKAMVQELREKLEQTQDKVTQKIQADSNALGQTLEEIDRKQKAFIAQSRIFERADELKITLENNIESLKGEITRLDVYRDTMHNLEQQYGKIKKLEEEAAQKVARFMTEKKRIDILETDFNKLLGLSDSIDRKISELTLTNDDLQQYQVQIRRFEESVAEVNGRYERLEKKAVVLDQTASGIDKAFENLKSLETTLHGYRDTVSGLPAELSGIRNNIESLLENKDKTALMVEKLSSLDMILDDVEKRTEKMQTAREWLARTETRLEEISKQSQDQLKLLGDLIKEDGGAKKSKGAPPIGIRENVVKLAHQGWKVDEIARALHLSRGEVELILELPQK